MKMFEQTRKAILLEAEKHYSDVLVLAKDTIAEGDTVWRFIVVSSDFPEDSTWDEAFCLELRETLNTGQILNTVEDVLVLVQPVSRAAFDREGGDITKVTDPDYGPDNTGNLDIGASAPR